MVVGVGSAASPCAHRQGLSLTLLRVALLLLLPLSSASPAAAQQKEFNKAESWLVGDTQLS
jgi:hypothetical protein